MAVVGVREAGDNRRGLTVGVEGWDGPKRE